MIARANCCGLTLDFFDFLAKDFVLSGVERLDRIFQRYFDLARGWLD
jgi:hypothetical protein